MNIRHFALQDWIDRDLSTLRRISTHDNYSDAMTKALARTLFYRHMNFIQGKIIPHYAYAYQYRDRQYDYNNTNINAEIKLLHFTPFLLHCTVSLHPIRNRRGSCTGNIPLTRAEPP